MNSLVIISDGAQPCLIGSNNASHENKFMLVVKSKKNLDDGMLVELAIIHRQRPM